MRRRGWLGLVAAAAVALGGAVAGGAGAAVAAQSPTEILVSTSTEGPAAVDEAVALTADVVPYGPGVGPEAPVTWALASGVAPVASVESTGPDTAVFQASRPGAYVIVARSGAASRPFSLSVYGPAAQVVVTAASRALAADGAATDPVTLTVEDANGVQVTDFDGGVRLSDSLGQLCQGGVPVRSAMVSVNQGQGTATLCSAPPGVVGTDALTATSLWRYAISGLNPVPGVRFTGAAVQDVAAAASQVAITPEWGGGRLLLPGRDGSTAPFYVPVTDLTASRAQSVTLAVVVEDAMGDPWDDGPRTVTVRLAGPGSLAKTAVVTSEALAYPAQSAFPVYSQVGRAGTVMVTASAPGLSSAAYTVRTYVNTTPGALRVLVSRGMDSQGMPYNLYDVQLVDRRGQPIPDALGDIRVTDDSSQLATVDPLAATYGRSMASILYAPGAEAGDPAAYRPGPPGDGWPVPLVNGVATFAIETGAEAASAAALTISDPALGLAVHGGYEWAGGQPSEAILLPEPTPVVAGCASVDALMAGCRLTVPTGRSVAFSAQVVSAHGDPVDQAGLPVLFTVAPIAPNAEAHFRPGVTASRWALTDAQGVATADVVDTKAGAPAYRVAVAFDQQVVAGGTATVDVTGTP